MGLKVVGVMLILVAYAMPVAGQVADLDKDRMPMAVLDGSLRFHPGDDPNGELGWASPGYDDSSWPLITTDKGLDEQGYKGLTGFVWFRVRILLPHQHRRLALYIPGLETSYEVYANGEKIGHMGGVPPHPVVQLHTSEVFSIPDNSSDVVVVALRVWLSPFFASFSGGLSGPPIVGDADLLYYWRAAQDKFDFWSNSASYSFAMIEFLAGAGGLILFLLRRKEREYLWFGAYELFNASHVIVDANLSLYRVPLVVLDFLTNSFLFAGQLCFLAFIFIILRHRGKIWFRIAFASVAINELFQIVFDSNFGRISITADSVIAAILTLPFAVTVLVLLMQGARRREPDSLLLLIPIGLGFLVQFIGAFSWIMLSLGRFPAIDSFRAWWTEFTEWPFPVGMEMIFNAMMQLAIFGILILRYASSRRDEERLRGEFEAARVVQQVLVPAEQPTIPGFVIASIYRPAGQVGGDFFQIVPTSAGGALVIIGDVSGKGMPAAMTVSLLVGTFGTLAGYTQSPGEILAAMNQRMLARSNGGFTTCLALRIDSEGELTVANAGHLTPYLGGKELNLENGLPLGLTASSLYPESTFELPPDTQLTLLTDGAIEARSKTGELFGFERVAALSTAPAELLARAAEEFGQEDDITVLSISRRTSFDQPTIYPGAVKPSWTPA